MKIISLIAENVKKLVAVEIKPDGNLVEITGKNGQGKTSVLDSIWWALAGAEHIQSSPIRQGANKARIRLDLGEIIVTRNFTGKEDGGYTTSLTVENADGARFPSPQRMLDSLLGELSFDPLAFARAKPKEQFDMLRRFVPEVDFEAIEAAHKADYQKRTEINRQAKEARAAAQAIVVPPDTPEQPIDEAALVAELERAGKHNADIERRKANRERAAAQVQELDAEAKRLRERATELRRQADELDAQAATKTNEAAALNQKLAAAETLPEPIDTAALREKIDRARTINDYVRKLAERKRLNAKADELETRATELTLQMAKRAEEKLAAIAAAKMPVPGLTFGDSEVLLNGVPFGQASDAEQLRASVAIAIAMNPKLRVVRIRDGSLLDDDAMKILGEMAETNDMQVWIERVDSSGKVGFVLEDGRLKNDQAQETA